MKTITTLFMLLIAHIMVCAQEPPPKPTASARCRGCVRRVVTRLLATTPTPLSQTPTEYFVSEARVDVTKDETVIRLAMAQHGSVLIELPANDGPRYIIPGDPDMATVDEKALERNKRAIVVRPGTQFVPPLRNQKTRSPSATVTAQMRSGLVVTFLFYPVQDLAQNVHRCVLNYNRDEVVARRRAAGLPVNLDGSGHGGEMTAQSAAPTSISVENSQDSEKGKKPLAETSVQSAQAKTTDKGEKVSEKSNDSELTSSLIRSALQEAIKQPKQFKKWTKAVHGLSLSVLQPLGNREPLKVIIVAVRNRTSQSLKLTPGIPDLFLEMLDDHHKPLNIESIKKLHTEASDVSGLVPAGGTVYYAVAYLSPILNVNQQVKVTVGQSDAADQPASTILAKSDR